MERLSRTRKFASLRESIVNDREELTNTNDLNHFKNRLGNIQEAFSNAETEQKPHEEIKQENVNDILNLIDDIFATKSDLKIPKEEVPQKDLMDDINKVLAGINEYNDSIGKTETNNSENKIVTPEKIEEDIKNEAKNKNDNGVGDTTIAFMTDIVNKINERATADQVGVIEQAIQEELKMKDVDDLIDEISPQEELEEEKEFDEHIKQEQETIFKNLTEEQPEIEQLVDQGIGVEDIIEDLKKDIEETQNLERSQLEAAQALEKQNKTLEEVNNIFENLRDKIFAEQEAKKQNEEEKEEISIPNFDDLSGENKEEVQNVEDEKIEEPKEQIKEELVEEPKEESLEVKLATTGEIHSINEDEIEKVINENNETIEKEVSDEPVEIVNTRTLHDEPDYVAPENTEEVVDEIEKLIEDVSPAPVDDVQIIDEKTDIFDTNTQTEDPKFKTIEVSVEGLKEEANREIAPAVEVISEEPIKEEIVEEITDEPIEETEEELVQEEANPEEIVEEPVQEEVNPEETKQVDVLEENKQETSSTDIIFDKPMKVDESAFEEEVLEVPEEPVEKTVPKEEALDSFEEIVEDSEIELVDDNAPIENESFEEIEDDYEDATANLTEDEITSFIRSTLDEVDQYNKAQGKTTVEEIPSTIINEVKGELAAEQEETSEETIEFTNTVNTEINKIMEEIASQNSEPIAVPKVEETSVPNEVTVSDFVDAFLSKKEETIEEEIQPIETPDVFNTMNENTKEQVVEIVNLAELEKTENFARTINFDEPDLDETIEIDAVEEEEEEYQETDVDTPNRVLNILLIFLIVALIGVLGFVVYEYLSAGMF